MLPNPTKVLADRVPRRWPAWVGALHLDRIAPWRAAGVTIGVVAPLLAGWWGDHTDWGAYMALGALPAGIVSFTGETRSGVFAVVIATLGMAISTFVGAVIPNIAPWLLVPVLALWGYLTGLSVCLGDRWSAAMLQCSIALLIAVGLPQTPSGAVERAGLVLAGGLFQAVLVAATWMMQPGRRERDALATSYEALAAYASRLASGESEAPPTDAFPAQSALDDPNPFLGPVLWSAFVNLLEQAERIRATLAALAAVAASDPSDGTRRNAFLTGVADALRAIVECVAAKQTERHEKLRILDARIAAATIAPDATWRWFGEAVLGQLRAVARTFSDIDASGPVSSSSVWTRPAGWAMTLPTEFFAGLASLRANMTLTTEAGRHAVRLAAVAALAETITQALHIYQGRWAALTLFFVLKPDYASTINRGAQRALGTVIGAILGGLAGQLTQHDQFGLVASAGIAIAIGYAFFDASYMVFSVMLTAFVVMLLTLLGMPLVQTAEARVYDTFIGAAIAVVAYIVWPTWQRSTAHGTFERLMEAHRAFGTALLHALAHPAEVDERELRAQQAAARRARSDAEAATVRLGSEPPDPRFPPEVAHLLSAAIGRVALAELALHALVVADEDEAHMDDGICGAAATLADFATAYDSTMNRIANALRILRAPEAIPPLRPIYDKLAKDPLLKDCALIPVIDRLVDATNTLYAILKQRLAPVGPNGSSPAACDAV